MTTLAQAARVTGRGKTILARAISGRIFAGSREDRSSRSTSINSSGIASPVIAAVGGQNAKRQSEHERGGDSDYVFGHHGTPHVHVRGPTRPNWGGGRSQGGNNWE